MKKIGIVGWKTGENSFGATAPYLHFINMLKSVFEEETYAVILAPNTPILEDLDLLILPGGLDTTPSMYGQDPGYFTSNQDVMKEHFFKTKFPSYVENGTPIFGICLGFQQIATYFGATLDQHRNFQNSMPRDERVEQLAFTPEAVHLKVNFGKTKYMVNSLHHQCIVDVSKDLDAIAFSLNYGNIEALRHKTLPIAGVQYHPEELGYDPLTTLLIQSIINK